MYSRGSNALKNEYFTYDEAQQNVTVDEAKAEIQAKKIARANKLKKQKAVALVAMIASMAFIVLLRYATIAKEFSLLTEKKNELSAVNALVVEAQMEAEKNVDPRRIAVEAERLGLSQPTKEQIKYISLGNKDNGEVLKTENKSGISAFINAISVILDYLY